MRLKNLYGEQVYYFFSDHLGSTNVITDPNGNVMSETLYKAWGEIRYSSGSSPTDYTYTGQRSEMDDIGLMFYNARWYSPELGRFAQADTTIPGNNNPSAWDRYSYVNNNSINFSDPTGHLACEDSFYGCVKNQEDISKVNTNAISYWKWAISRISGIKMVDSAEQKWGLKNLQTAFRALDMINNILNGNLRSMVNGTLFTITGGGNQYYGITNSTGVTYHVHNQNTKIPLINFLHETGHLLDSVTSTKDVFSDPFRSENGGAAPTWVHDGYVDRALLGNKFKEPVQAKPMNEADSPNEFWADAFANYVAGNINLLEPSGEGQKMYDYVHDALNPYANPQELFANKGGL